MADETFKQDPKAVKTIVTVTSSFEDGGTASTVMTFDGDVLITSHRPISQRYGPDGRVVSCDASLWEFTVIQGMSKYEKREPLVGLPSQLRGPSDDVFVSVSEVVGTVPRLDGRTSLADRSRTDN